MNEAHRELFKTLVLDPNFKKHLLGLLTKGETNVRLKSHELLEILANYYVSFMASRSVYEIAEEDPSGSGSFYKDAPGHLKGDKRVVTHEVDYISVHRLALIQMFVNCAKTSLDVQNDSYLQFSALILLDNLFQNLMPVPSYANEMFKLQNARENASKISRSEVPDVETMNIDPARDQYEVTDVRYLSMRLSLVFKLWHYV